MKYWHLVLILVIVCISAAASAQPQEPAAQINIAVSELSTYVGRALRLADLDSYAWEQDFYTNSNLGCAAVQGVEFGQGFFAFRITMVLDGVTYEWRVSQDGSISFPCDAALLAGTPAAPQFLPTIPPELNLNTQCPPDFAGFLPPRLIAGRQARVEAGGLPNRLRNAPTTLGAQIGVIQPGRTVNVLQGPACADTTVWWQVEIDGTVGWTAEGLPPDNYFLEPVDSPSTFVLTSPPPSPAGEVIDAANAADLAEDQALEEVAFDFAWSPDGRWFALTGETTALYEYPALETSALYSDAAFDVGAGAALAFSPASDTLMLGTEEGALYLYGLATRGRTQPSYSTQVAQLLDVAFSDQGIIGLGRAFIGATGGELRLIDGPATAYYSTVGGITVPRASAVQAVAFSADGVLAAILDGESVLVVNVVSGEQLVGLPLGFPDVDARRDIVFVPSESSYVVAFTDGDSVRIVDLNSGDEDAVAPLPPNAVTRLALNPAGDLLAVVTEPEADDEPYTVDLVALDALESVFSLDVEGAVDAVGFDPSGSVFAIATEDGIIFYTIAPAVG